MSKSKLKFKVGDEVESAPDSSDVVQMQTTWYATIHRIVGENNHGGCYETIGSWSDENPNGEPTLSSHPHRLTLEPRPLTLRQLWGDHLTLTKVTP